MMSEPRSRKAGATSIAPSDLKTWIDAVPVGACVTLPDGTVIDKRPIPMTLPATPWATPWATPASPAPPVPYAPPGTWGPLPPWYNTTAAHGGGGAGYTTFDRRNIVAPPAWFNNPDDGCAPIGVPA